MAKRNVSTEKRLMRVEASVDQIHAVLREQAEQTDARLQRVTDRLDAITSRLDRLIAVTMHARTADIERFAEIERRLSRVEDLLGV